SLAPSSSAHSRPISTPTGVFTFAAFTAARTAASQLFVEFPVASTRRTTIGPAALFLDRRAGIRTARAGPSRATFAAVLHRGPRFDRRQCRELEDLVDHDRELLAQHLTRLRAGARREERADDETDEEKPERRPKEREHQAARPFGG